MKKNLFIAFEGIDGSGKSTQVKLLKEKLEAKGLKVYTTCEPTDSPMGKMIREIFMLQTKHYLLKFLPKEIIGEICKYIPQNCN